MISEFLSMGGYGEYVWSAYALSAAVLILNAVVPWRSEKAALKRLAGREPPATTR